MKNKNIFLLFLCIISSIIYNFIPEEKVVLNNSSVNKLEENIQVAVLSDNSVIKIPLEDYVIGVVAAEMPASFSEEALKAQAIASRTYAMYKINKSNELYDVTTDVTTQSYIDIEGMEEKWGEEFDLYYNKIKEAVQNTNNLVMKSDNEIICAYYFAMSNGYTEDSISVFSQELSYTKSVESPWDENVNNFEVMTKLSKTEFCSKLGINCDNIIIDNITRSETNRVEEITINDKVIKGTDFRYLLGIRSTDFDISVLEEILITTRGYGHGVGMSQYGASEMANNGSSYEDILKHYYKNIEIENI